MSYPARAEGLVNSTFMLHSFGFFSLLARIKYSYLFCFLWFSLSGQQEQPRQLFGNFSLFSWLSSISCFLAGIRGYFSIRISRIILCVLFFRRSNFNHVHSYPRITVPTQAYLVSNSFCNYYYYYYYLLHRVFHISVSWWFFTGVWVTASLLKSPGLV